MKPAFRKRAFPILLCGLFVLPAMSAPQAGDKVITARQKDGLSVALVSNSGKFTSGENTFCVLFSRKLNAEAVSVQEVLIEFSQQVGRIREQPIRATMTEEKPGRYCGEINLGKQYYDPAFYHVNIQYKDDQNTKKRRHFFLAVRP